MNFSFGAAATVAIGLCFSFLGSSALAQDYVISPKKSGEVIEEDSSAHHRVDKKYQINGILYGAGPSLGIATGYQGAYFLNRNELILLELTRGSLNGGLGSLSESWGSIYDVSTRSLGLHYKKFSGNSFYYRVGGDLRSVDYKYTSNYSGSTQSRKFKGASLAANFQIGNQWQWENFTLGCDWIGISIPITSRVTDEEVVSSTPDLYSRWLDEESSLYVKNGHLNLLRFYLGASF